MQYTILNLFKRVPDLTSKTLNGISKNPERMSIVKKIPLILFAFLCSYTLRAQQFDYTVSCDSNGTYQELSSQTILNTNNSAWNFSYRVPVGFAFNFLGQNFDSVTVERNGYLCFDKDRSYALMAFNAFHDKEDSLENHSVLSYAQSGSTPNRILKIQYKNVGQSGAASELLSYQLWLKESGALEVHIGPHTQLTAEAGFDTTMIAYVTEGDSMILHTNYYDTLMPVQIGLLNTNMDSETRGLFLKGSPTQPASQPVNDQNPGFAFMRSLGRAGTTYIFTPQQ